MQPSPGKPNFNILKMARDGINFELRDALLKAAKSKEAISKVNVVVKDQPYLASFEVAPLDTDDLHNMVLFYKKPLPEIKPPTKSKIRNADQQRIVDLENELTRLREDIKRVTEEQQTAFEELQTVNEELLSSNEELQAMNEELETSQEELQSNNEELMCVNDELMDRQEQLISLRNYSESIINTIREPLIIIDKNLIIKSANPAFYRYFRTTEHETEGQSFFEIGDCQWDVPEFKELLTSMLKDKAAVEDFKVAINCKGIGKKVMMVNALCIVESVPPEMTLLALEDITELVNANVLLTETNNNLTKYNNQLEQFTSAASHDLQEPLRKIQMFSQRILGNAEELSESNKHNLERILFSATNLRQLITDLIEYSRSSLSEKQFKTTNLNTLMKKIIQDMKDILADKNAIITTKDLPTLNVIPFQIQQLFTNLISNAVKYSRKDVQPEIKIDSEPAIKKEIEEMNGNPEIRYIKVTVQDNGIGFGKEYEKRVFDAFYRLHNHDEYQGSGIGLALSKKIVENHKGFINASSEVNKGTLINIFMPL